MRMRQSCKRPAHKGEADIDIDMQNRLAFGYGTRYMTGKQSFGSKAEIVVKSYSVAPVGTSRESGTLSSTGWCRVGLEALSLLFSPIQCALMHMADR